MALVTAVWGDVRHCHTAGGILSGKGSLLGAGPFLWKACCIHTRWAAEQEAGARDPRPKRICSPLLPTLPPPVVTSAELPSFSERPLPGMADQDQIHISYYKPYYQSPGQVGGLVLCVMC